MQKRQTTWIDEPVIGERVRVTSAGKGWQSTSSGIYVGVLSSEWDGKPSHYFVDGEINGLAQRCFGFPAEPGTDLTSDKTLSEILSEAVA